MQAQDVMVRGVISVGPDIPVQVAANAMVRNGVSALPVIDITARLVGIVSEGDLIRRAEIDTDRQRSSRLEPFTPADTLAQEFVKSHGKRVSDVMTRDVITATPETPLREIANLMEKHGIKRVPIVHSNLVVGIVSRANLIQAVASARPKLEVTLPDSIIRQQLLGELKKHSWAHAHNLSVTVTNGIVDLWGYADSGEERQAIRVIAEAVPGVTIVKDHLAVSTPFVY